MASTHSSVACETTPIPTSASSSYEPLGTYSTYVDTKCYITGPRDAKTAVFFLYDVFGFQQPTLQGADILAKQGGHLVVMPDLLDGSYCRPEWLRGFGADSDPETKQRADEFLARIRDPEPHLRRIQTVLAALQDSEQGQKKKWAAIGFCWGGKLVSLSSAAGTPWSVGVQSSPASIDAKDAEKCVVPMMMLASSGENKDDVDAFRDALRVDNQVEYFGNMVHGWMSARADLQSTETRTEFERGYGMVIAFLAKHL